MLVTFDLKEDFTDLSRRERQILRLLGEGTPTKAVSIRLGISGKTVESHRRNIKIKCRLRNGHELIRFAVLYSLWEKGNEPLPTGID